MSYFDPLLKLERQRKKSLKSDFPQPLLPLLQRPIWDKTTRLWNIEFLVLDFETTGLKVTRDDILSMGWVVVKNGQIQLDSAHKIDVVTERCIKPEAAVINHIVSDSRVHAVPIQQAMQRLLTFMKGRVLVAHSAAIEKGFFYQYCQRSYNITSIALVWLDTMRIEKSLLHSKTKHSQSDFQLSAIRSRYGLPDYPGHDALIDAVATAELFLAQVKTVFGSMVPYLGPMVERS